MRVGILGGSFNPAHAGHIHISEIALKSLGLDAIWWMVTPKNPLKSENDLLSMAARVEYARKLLDNHPKILVTDIEKSFKTTYSYDSIKKLKKCYPNTEFAWITGMDNAHSLHLWEHWKDLLGEICMVHITRNPPIKLVKNCPVRMVSTQKNIILNHGICAELTPNTTYWILQKRNIDISSTKIRAKNILN